MRLSELITRLNEARRQTGPQDPEVSVAADGRVEDLGSVYFLRDGSVLLEGAGDRPIEL